MKSTASGVFEDLKFKISEGYKQNWNFKLNVVKYQWNFRPHATVISNLVKPLMYILIVQGCEACKQVSNYLWYGNLPIMHQNRLSWEALMAI